MVGTIDLMKKGLRLNSIFDISSFSLVGTIDLMKKGLRPTWSKLYKRCCWMLERLTWWRRDCDISGKSPEIFVHSSLERLTWWRRDCDDLPLTTVPFLNFLLERLTWWRRDCDQHGEGWMVELLFVGTIDLMKKGLRLFSWNCFFNNFRLERLTWWRRDCDYGIKKVSLNDKEKLERLTWWRRDCDHVDDVLRSEHLNFGWNDWPDEEGIATLNSISFK